MCRGDSSVKYTISYNYRLLICEGIFAFCKNVYIFAMHNILNGGESCHSVAGIFFRLLTPYGGSVPPCGVLMHPQPLSGVMQRDRRNRFFSS